MTTDSKGQTFIFQFSCIQSDFRSKLESQISQLNGKFDSTSKELLPTCTHLVVSALSRTEKFLSALAKGLWIVEPSYIETCSRAKKWLDPELHEWSIPCLTADDSDQVIRGDIGRRRRLSRIKSNKLAFSGWTCAVTDVTPKQRYERILRHGGAKVVQSDEKLTHLFTEEMPPEGSRNKHTAVSVMFIGAYLLMDNVKMSDFPPSILENSVKVLGDNNTSNRTALVGKKLSTQKSLKRQLTLEESFDFGNNAKKRKFFGGLLCQSNSDSSTCNSPLRQKSQSNKSAASNLKQTGKDIVKRSLFHNDENTNKKTCKSGVVAKTITTISKKVLPNRISRGKAAPKYDEDYNSPLPWSSKKSGTTPSRTTPSRTTPGRTTPKQYTGKALNKLQPSNVKSQSKLISNEKSEQTKCQSRRKNNQSSRDAVATRESCRVNLFDKKINMQPRVVLKRLDEKTIQNFGMQKRDTPVKKKRVHYSSANIALAMKRLAARKKSQSSNKRMPHHPSLLPMSFVSVNEPLSVNRSLSINQSLPMPLPTVMYNLFEATLGGMPEVSLQIVNHYITKLRYPNCSLIRDVLHLIKTCPEQTSIMAYLTMKRLLDIHPPHTIREVYAHAFGATEDDTEFVQKTAINSVLSVIKYCVYENSTEDIACQPVTVNFQNYCRAFQVIIAILDADANLVQCVDKYKCKTLICQFIWGSGNIGIMNSNVRKILQYFVDSIELAEYKVSSLLARLITIIVETAFDRNIPSEILHLFAMEFAQHLKLCKNTSLLEIAFNKIHPSWLSQMICEKMLDQYDNSLLSNLEPQNEICLGSMISKSFYLHPTFKQLISTPHKKKQSTPPKQVAQRNPAAKWRNSRGESKLHRACITNNIPQVKQLLATPGVNVNAADNYGWTALHECCNHGHVECVKLLLAHKPVMSMESFLNKATKHCDTRAVSKDGTTPLHDAVNNGQTSIAVLLLRHSGADLLTLRNLDGQLPVDKAETEEMKTALQNYDDDSQSTEILSFPSQSSQGSNDGVCHSKLACCQRPSAEVYDWVLGVRNDNNPSSKQAASHTGVPTGTTPHQRQCSPESCALFLCILHQYVSSYLENNNLIELHAELCAIQGGELGAGDSDIIVSDSDIKAAQRDLKVLRYFDCHVTGLSQHIELLCEEYLSSQNNSPNNVITEECSNIQKYLRNLYLLCHS